MRTLMKMLKVSEHEWGAPRARRSNVRLVCVVQSEVINTTTAKGEILPGQVGAGWDFGPTGWRKLVFFVIPWDFFTKMSTARWHAKKSDLSRRLLGGTLMRKGASKFSEGLSSGRAHQLAVGRFRGTQTAFSVPTITFDCTRRTWP